MSNEQPPAFDGANYEERLKQFEKEKKGILNDLQEERQTRRSLEQRLATIESSLSSAGSEDGETVEQKVQRLANQPDEYIDSRLQAYDESRVKPLEQELSSIKIDRQIEKGLRWVAKQEKKDYEDVTGSSLEEELARVTVDMRNRGIIPTDPYEGTKQAYKLLLEERREKQDKEKERDEKIESNQTERSTPYVTSSPNKWTRASIEALSLDEYTQNESEIKRAVAAGLVK